MSVPVNPPEVASAPTAPGKAPALPAPDISLRMQVELVRMAFRELVSGTLASTGAVIAFAVAVSSRFSGTALWVWLALMVGFGLYRLWLARRFTQATVTPANASSWKRRYVAATTLTGMGWGLSTWILPTLLAIDLLALVHVLLLAGLATGSARLLLPLRMGSILYLCALMLPLAGRFAVLGGLVGFAAAGCILLFVAYMISANLHNHATLAAALRLGFEREALTAELQAEIERRREREAELGDARERAELASRAKGEFLATISHEIRTPMNGVLGMLRVVRDTPLSDEQRHYLNTAADSAESLLLLLNDVLDFSKIEAGRLEIAPGPFSPARLAQGVTDLLLTRARDKGLQFELKLDAQLPAVVVNDPTRVRQVLVNLLGNAIKFTERGRVELHVSCAERSASQAVLHFAVTDTGIGIDAQALERLFKPFTQADASLTRRFGGTGLGLAISQRLALAMGGVLQVQSAVNRGSLFRLILPCPLPESHVTAEPDSVTVFAPPILAGRVLVVEDDSVNQQVIELFLRKMHVTTRLAPDGEAAVAAATSETFDVVLMDCQLPGIDGLEATRRIRAHLAGRPLPIVALTASASSRVRDDCLAAGMDDFLTKPVRMEQLANLLGRYLVAR